jgi:hypothetical protein
MTRGGNAGIRRRDLGDSTTNDARLLEITFRLFNGSSQ